MCINLSIVRIDSSHEIIISMALWGLNRNRIVEISIYDNTIIQLNFSV